MCGNIKELDMLLEQKIREYKYSGVQISVRGPEGIIYERGFGYRCLEPPKEVNADTIFGIASMSKSMTALACCILAAEGKMSLDDPLVKYFPTLHLPGIPDETVTVKHLALHRAGIPPMEPLEWSIAMNSIERENELHNAMVQQAPNKMDKIEQIIDYLSEGRYGSLGAAGEYMSYSNEGYALLSYIVDQAAGICLEEFLKQRIFEPLGMSRTVLDIDGSEARKIAADDNVTSLFETDENGSLVWDDNFSVLPPFRGCACVKSTANDLCKYYQMLSNWGEFEGKQVIPYEAVEYMIGREFPLKRKPFYCMGLRKWLLEGKMMCDHQGELHGTSTQGGFIEGGYSVVALCNQGEVDVEPLQWICYNYLLGLPLETDLNWAKPSGNSFSKQEMLCGDYIVYEGIPAHCIVSLQDGQLVCMHNNQKKILRHCEKTVFAVYDAENPENRVGTFRFYIKDGNAWAVKCGSRIYLRIDE